MSQKTKPKNELARATLASVTKEMARPRFAESAREEEEDANLHVAKDELLSAEMKGEAKRKKPRALLCHALLAFIAVMMTGFLGFGVRAFSTPDTTRLVFSGLVVVSIGILVWYFMRRRSTRDLTAHSPFREPTLVKASIFSRLLAWRPSVVQWMRSAGLVLSRVWHRIGDSFLPRKVPMKRGEQMSPEAGVVRVPKLPTSRRAA